MSSLWHHPLLPFQHRASPLAPPNLSFPLLPSLSPPLSLYTLVSYLLPLSQHPSTLQHRPSFDALSAPSSIHFRTSTLFGPRRPPLISTVQPNRAKTEGPLFGFPSVQPCLAERRPFIRVGLSGRTKQSLFDQIRPNEGPLFGPDWLNEKLVPGEGTLGRCQGVKRIWRPKRGAERRPLSRNGGCWGRRRRGQR